MRPSVFITAVIGSQIASLAAWALGDKLYPNAGYLFVTPIFAAAWLIGATMGAVLARCVSR